jgi:hypothetical protein
MLDVFPRYLLRLPIERGNIGISTTFFTVRDRALNQLVNARNRFTRSPMGNQTSPAVSAIVKALELLPWAVRDNDPSTARR